MRRIAMFSVHTCPMAALGGKETGGMNVYVRELSRELGANGLAVDIFTRSQDATRDRVRELWPGVRVVHLRAGPEEPYAKELVYPHLPEFLQGFFDFAASEGQHYDLAHSHYWLSGWVALEVGRRLQIPTVHMFHTLARGKDAVARHEVQKELSERANVEALLIRDVNRIVAATPLDREQMVHLYQADSRHIVVIPLGVDTRMFHPVPRGEAMHAIGVDFPQSPRLILFVGRLDPLKGLDNLLGAMCKLSEMDRELATHLCLAIIGGDAEEDPADLAEALDCLEELKNEAGLEDLVAFLGSRAQDTLAYYYSAAEVCVVPSYYESFGLVALEAMACGTPVIASRVGGLQHTVEDGVTGFLVPAGDEDALAEKLLLILSDGQLRGRLGANGRHAAARYTWRSVADKVLAVYEELWQINTSS
jgi:D-inositol-3-phosphate glycosyltransferase